MQLPPWIGRPAPVAVCLAILTWFSGFVQPAASQQSEGDAPARLAMFLDCGYCPDTFVRQEMPYVDHVRDREVADVHVLVTNVSTGSGGDAHTFDLIGLRSFQGMEFSTVFTTSANSTESEQRDGFIQTLEAALVPYLMGTSMRSRLHIEVDPAEEQQGEEEVIQLEDPWDFWTVEMYADGGADFESQQRSYDTRYGVYVGRVTENWKIQLRPFFNYNYDRFERGDRIIESTSRRDGFTSYAVKSVSPHLSVGAFADIFTSTFANVDWRYRAMPAIEWSLYPYREATRRQLTVAYRVGASHITYRDTTIYNEIQQVLPQHLLNADYEVIQPWGQVEVGVTGSQYLDDLSLLSLSVDAEIEVRITRGLSVEVGGSVEFIRDQINLPKGDADLEEVLLRRRELETNYEAGLSFGFRYRFGSIYNNVVNTRFGGIGNRDRF